MYKISIPVLLNERSVKEDIYESLKNAGAQRVFLAIDVISLNDEKNKKHMEILREFIPYFKSKGFEVGVWFWTFWRSDLTEEYLNDCMMESGEGRKRTRNAELNSVIKKVTGFCCPASQKFVSDAMKVIKEIATLNPDIMMFDDDYRFGTHGDSGGCYCKHHLKMVSEKLGRNITREELYKAVYEGKPNVERKAYSEAMGESLENFAIKVRETVDSVNPKIRFALCSVLSLWDNDGTDSMKISKLLAGNTKPLMRLIGAPYWAMGTGWNVSLNNVVELERMEQGWIDDEDIEIMTEGDVYPRPRYRVPAAYLECFDTVLRAADVGDGILKYMMDYTSSTSYEDGYIRRHNENKNMYDTLERFFGDKNIVGVRVYEPLNKFANADFSDMEKPDQFAEDMFISRSVRLLSDNSLPSTYTGKNCVGIALAESARHLPPEAFENGLILDIRAAGILMEQGIDVGIEKIGKKIINDLLYYTDYDEYVKSNYSPNSAYELKLKNGARVLTYSTNGDDERMPDSFLYENENGHRFLVLGFDASFTSYNSYRTYCMQKMLYSACEWLSGKKLPAKCEGNPGLYILCKKDNDGNMAVGLWNMFADEILQPEILLSEAYESVEALGCYAELNGNRLRLSDLPAYGFAFLHVK